MPHRLAAPPQETRVRVAPFVDPIRPSLASACALLLFASFVAHAQAPLGRLYVRVYDQTDAVLPGVTLTLSGTGMRPVTAVTGILGDFAFIRLPQGRYDLTCELDGFSPHAESQIRISGGATVSLRILLTLAPLAETVTVLAPVEPISRAGLSHTFSHEELERTPLSRDPAGVSSLVAGIIIDRADLGAWISGRQTLIGGFGDLTGRNTAWNLEGLTITDVREVGSSPIQYDFDSFEQIEITSGGADPSVATGGITLNLVAKEGGDAWSGSARLLLSGARWQSNNTDALASGAGDFIWSSSFQRPVISRWYETGFESGGPLLKHAAWLWAGAGFQQIDGRAVTGTPDETGIANGSLKLNGIIANHVDLSYTFLGSRRTLLGPGYRESRPIETSLQIENPTALQKIECELPLRDGLQLTARAGYVSASESTTPVAGMEVPAIRDEAGDWSGSYRATDFQRPQWEIESEAFYARSMFGFEQQLRFGFSFRRAESETHARWPGGGVISDRLQQRARITRPAHSRTRNDYIGIYANDTFTIGRVTMSIGARVDRQTGALPGAVTPGSAIYADLLPAVRVEARESPVSWLNLSPRVAATIDLTGRGRTFLRASYARYADQLSAALLAGLSPISTAGELTFPWIDSDGDGIADAGEIDFSAGAAETYNIDPLDPAGTRSRRAVAPGFKAPRRTEIILGIEHEPAFGVVLGANIVWKKLVGNSWIVGTDYMNPASTYGSGDYEIAGYVSGTLPDGTSYSVPYYKLGEARASMMGAGVDSLLTNRRGSWEEYVGFEVSAAKSLSARWTARASVSWQRNRLFFSGTEGIADPTGVYAGADIISLSDVGGRAEYWIGAPRWHFVGGGLGQLPLGIDLSINLSGRQGYPLVYFERLLAVDPGSFRKDVPIERPYERALPSVWQVDMRIARSFAVREKVNIGLSIDVFNAPNRSTPLQVDGRLGVRSTNEVKELMQPRTVRAGVRITF